MEFFWKCVPIRIEGIWNDVVAKFGENRPSRSRWTVIWYCYLKNFGSLVLVHPSLATLVRAPHFTPSGPIGPKILWTLSCLNCACVPNFVRIGCGLPELLRRGWLQEITRLHQWSKFIHDSLWKIQPMESVMHGCRDWRTAGQRARAWQPTGGHPVVVQSDQMGGQTEDPS